MFIFSKFCLLNLLLITLLYQIYCADLDDSLGIEDDDVEDEDDVAYVPDEVDLPDENEFEVIALEHDIVKIQHILPSINQQSFDASQGEPWTDQPPNIEILNEFEFQDQVLPETDVNLSELDIFNTIFIEEILNK